MSDQERTFRSFGFLVGGVFGGLGALSFLVGRRGHHWVPLVAAALLIGPAAIYPRALAPIYRVWMLLARALGWLNTRLLLAIAFFLMFTPVGLLRKWVVGDALERDFDHKAASYRVRRQGRPSSHMRHQF